jgi:hypothetical protein
MKMSSRIRLICVTVITIVANAASARAQSVGDPTTRLRQVLPADVATRVLAVIQQARTRGLPADALENRALKFAAKGVDPNAIEKSVVEQEGRMERVRDLLQTARARKPADDEIEAGAEALRKGIDASQVATLAKEVPADRSLAVPLYVIGSLIDRGLPSDAALRRVEDKLRTRASDHDIEKMAIDVSAGSNNGRGDGAETGRALGVTKHPGAGGGSGNSNGSAGGPPAGVPGNGGKPATPPGQGKKPQTPPGKKP